MPRRPRRQVMPRSDNRTWYRIENRAGDTARIYLLGSIGDYGITADEFVRELNGILASTIELHISSPGGDVFSALAMFQAVKDHPANVVVQIDGLAASAASFIAQAGDEVLVAPKATVMVHDANGLALGNAADMRETADILDKCSDNIASIYADSAGGTVEEWRDIMRAETWYSAEEAVAAGLADGIVGQDVEEEAPQRQQPALAASFDLSKFRYPGRDAAPAPKLPTAQAEEREAPAEVHAEEPAEPAEPAEAAPKVLRACIYNDCADSVADYGHLYCQAHLDELRSIGERVAEAAPEPAPEPAETPSRTDDAGAESPVTDEDTWGALVAQLTTTIAPLDPVGDALASLREAMQ